MGVGFHSLHHSPLVSGIDYLPFVELDFRASRLAVEDDGSTGAISTLSGGVRFDGSFRFFCLCELL